MASKEKIMCKPNEVAVLNRKCVKRKTMLNYLVISILSGITGAVINAVLDNTAGKIISLILLIVSMISAALGSLDRPYISVMFILGVTYFILRVLFSDKVPALVITIFQYLFLALFVLSVVFIYIEFKKSNK